MDTVTGYDPLDTEGLEKSREEAGKERQKAEMSEESDFRWLMGSRRGRRIVWRLLDKAGVFRSSFDSRLGQMAFNEGNRNYGLRILDQVHTCCPELYPAMMKENFDGRPDERRANNK